MRGEDRLTAWLRRRLGPATLIGDDAAPLPAASLIGTGAGGALVAATVDQQIEGIHFPAGLDPAVVARRLLAVNLSDMAAVGAEPVHALLALAAAPGFDHRRFLAALTGACARHGTTLAGGDLASLPEPGPSGAPRLAASLTLLGRMPAGGAWLARRAARPGDAVWVGGTLGESALGRHLLARGARFDGRRIELPEALGLTGALAAAARRAIRRHLSPAPQLELGRALGRLAAGHPDHPPAAIDLSDGLARDLARLCRESATGAEIDLSALPLATHARELAGRLDLGAIDLALGGGEDYVLLFTLPERSEPPASHCVRIGRIIAGGGLTIIEGKRRRPLPESGWDHLESK